MLKLFKAQSLKNTNFLTSNCNERTQEKAILKEGIGVNGKLTCTKRAGTRGFSFATYTPSKMGFAVRGSKKQRGRSMVEMLGVLAIIGVLSIGGIQGYTLAMRKYKANEVLNVVQKYAMMLYSGCRNAMEKDPQRYGIVGPDTNYLNDSGDFVYADRGVYGMWICPGVKFTDAGLGSLPNGVLEFNYDASNYTPLVNENGYGGVSIKSLSSGDAVVITLEFESQDLCETVMGIVGKSVSSTGDTRGMISKSGSDFSCQKWWGNEAGGYHLAIPVMMN